MSKFAVSIVDDITLLKCSKPLTFFVNNFANLASVRTLQIVVQIHSSDIFCASKLFCESMLLQFIKHYSKLLCHLKLHWRLIVTETTHEVLSCSDLFFFVMISHDENVVRADKQCCQILKITIVLPNSHSLI